MKLSAQESLAKKAIVNFYQAHNEAPPITSPAYKEYLSRITDAKAISITYIATFAPRPPKSKNQEST